jgi:inorganic pyrophosphatase
MKFTKEQTVDELYVFVQVSKGSKNFYKYDEDSDSLEMSSSLKQPFPGNYGFCPKTHHDDAEPLDAIILTDEPLEPGSIVRVKAIGLIRLSGQVNDDIIIAVTSDKTIEDVSELSMKQLNEITNYFETFKNLKTQKVFDSAHAKKVIEHAIMRYKKEFR